MCNVCNCIKCCCPVKKVTVIGKKGKVGPPGPTQKAIPGPPGPPFVPSTYYVERTSFTTLSNVNLTLDDPDCVFSNVPAGKYLVLFEANFVANRDTTNPENLDFSIYINGTLLRRTHTLHNYPGLQAPGKAVTKGIITLVSTSNVKVNYMITSTFPTVSVFTANPSQSVNIQEGSLILIKLN